MSKINFDALNQQPQSQPQKESEARSLEEHFRKKLSEGVNGNPETLRRRYQELKDALTVELSNRELASRGDESLKKQAQADIERMTQLLNKIYFEQSANLEIQEEPLPPEPVYRGVSKPSGYLPQVGIWLLVIGVILAVLIGVNGGDAGVASALVIVAVFIGQVLDIFVRSSNEKKKTKWGRYEKEYKAYQAQHAEWTKLKEERELRQRSSKARDEMSKFFHN